MLIVLPGGVGSRAGSELCWGAEKPTFGGGGEGGASAAAIAGSKEDPAAVERGGKLYVTNCGGCHGAGAQGRRGRTRPGPLGAGVG